MNLLGMGLLAACLNEGVADRILRQWCVILPRDTPYRHSEYGHLWLWWAIIGAGFFGAINIAAATWPPEIASVVVWGDVYAYGAFELLAIAGSLSPRYGPGVHVCHVLWLGQAGWGAATQVL